MSQYDYSAMSDKSWVIIWTLIVIIAISSTFIGLIVAQQLLR